MSGKVREYKVRLCKNCGRAQGDTPCAEYRPGGTVTAIDSRDVGPLVEAAKDLVSDFRDPSIGRGRLRIEPLLAALTPFLDEETEVVEGIQGGSE